MKTTRTALSSVVEEFLRFRYSGDVRVHDSKSTLNMDLPLAVVYVESASPIAPDEDIWKCTVRVTVMHDAERTTPADAEEDSADLFEAMRDSVGFAAFSEDESMAISASHVTNERLDFVEMRWHHVQEIEVIAGLCD